MKKLVPYMSFWSNSYKDPNSTDIKNLHKLSAFFLKKNFGEVHFITDQCGAEIFKDIPWTTVSTELNSIDKSYNLVWSISKLYAYRSIAQKGVPFVHVDYDVILWEGLHEKILNAEIFAQSPENAVLYFYELDKLRDNCPSLYDIKNYFTENASNVGVFGGHDLEFIQNYAQSAIDFVMDPDNYDFWINYNGFKNQSWAKAVIAEQYYLSIMAKKYNKTIEYIFPNGWPSDQEANEKKYTHLMGMKASPEAMEKVQKLVYKYKL